MQRILPTLAGLLLASAATVTMAETAAPEDASVYFISPTDGATVSSPVTVQFGLSGMGVAPAGVERAATGHHHLLIDTDQLPPSRSPSPSSNRPTHPP